jgi:hypothetical protein
MSSAGAAPASDFEHYSRRRLSIGVAIDGSQLSEKALKAACAFLNPARKDELTILHVAPANATARHLQPAHLKHTYTSLAWDFMGRQKQVPAMLPAQA